MAQTGQISIQNPKLKHRFGFWKLVYSRISSHKNPFFWKTNAFRIPRELLLIIMCGTCLPGPKHLKRPNLAIKKFKKGKFLKMKKG